ncbi:MAG: RND transporter [Gammaproteobacteria bacterium]|nr:RND transporter [Phycisphaerae bacterium]NIW44601.1 RND transporter [Gammaproteobacteria bacterium]NIX02751.1 RND transporter [Phycisphaerae bacterium]
MLVKFLENILWTLLVPVAFIMGLAPFRPEPHLFEKVRMLVNAQLVKPVDIFDLCMHGAPLLLVLAKIFFQQAVSPGSE